MLQPAARMMILLKTGKSPGHSGVQVVASSLSKEQFSSSFKEAGVKWRIYAADSFPVVAELDGVSVVFDIREFEDFAKDLQDP